MNDNELFDDNFGEWLEAHGVTLHRTPVDSSGFHATIKLNELKVAILDRDAAIRIDTMHTAWARALHGVNSGDDLTLIREYIKSEFDAAQKELVERRKSDLVRSKEDK